MAIEELQATLMDGEMYADVAAAGAGYMVPFIAENAAERYSPVDIPSEAVGILTAAALMVYAPGYQKELGLGAGVYAVERGAERVGIKDTVVNLGA
jgi:hypothetical protein